MEGVSKAAIERAKEWLKSATLNRDNDNYAKNLYDLEMSLELAIKAVMLALGKNFPKKHEIGTLFRQTAIANKNKLPKELNESLEEIETTFNELLELKAASGYNFESDVSKEDFKAFSKKYHNKAVNSIGLCERAVSFMNKR